MKTAVVIPFRDRGNDHHRRENLTRVYRHWQSYYMPGTVVMVTDDGRSGDAPFNRSAAYNLGVTAAPDAEVFIFAESDMLLPYDQVTTGVDMAREQPGLVVPFTLYRYHGPENSLMIRGGAVEAEECRPRYVMDGGTSIGAINIVSARTMTLIGQWDETFEGNWYDDDAMKIAFERCAGPTRWVTGPADHLYHLPGHRGKHLTEVDRNATRHNKIRLGKYKLAETPERIRELTAGGL